MFILKYLKRYFIIILFLTFNLTHSQAEFAVLKKNINVLAEGLNHELNETKDTLILSSPSRIYRVYTAGTHSGKVDQYMLANEFKVPLNLFERGKYVFCVDQLRYKIVFTVFVLKGQELMPGEFLMDSALASNVKKEVEPTKKAVAESAPKMIKAKDLPKKAEAVTETISKKEHHSKSVFETWDLLKDAGKLTNSKEPRKEISKIPTSKNGRVDKLAQVSRSAPKAKKTKTPLMNPNFYNLTDLNRNGVQSREEARRIMATKRQKIRDSIKNRIKNQK
ncbi:MAG: hypothetical protein KJO77_02250 [Bacteroidia bacterium]|nr:hypothetical protein [Bacteroidia bacterium]NND52603.1 hypothetical protein [Flavobacteriaceae bacterium]